MIDDLLALQKDLPTILKKDATNPFFKSGYLSLPKLLETILPKLNKHNFVLMQHPCVLDGSPALLTELLHTSGEKLSSTMLLFSKSADSQAQGSAISYARRYAITSILGLAADDDDGQSATEETKKPSAEVKIRGMFAVVKALGITDSVEAKAAIKRFAGIESLNDLDYEKATEVLELLKKTDPESFIATYAEPF